MGWSVYRYETWNAALRWTALAAVFFVAYEALSAAAARRIALPAIAAFGAALAIVATAQYYTSNGQYFWLIPSGQPDVFGPFQNKNNYAACVELMLPMTLWEALRRGRRRGAGLVLAGIIGGSVGASGSPPRGPFGASRMPAGFG